MKLSTRNQIAGTVEQIHTGEVMASVKVKLAGGDVITAAVTAEAVADLGLETGIVHHRPVKATEVMLHNGLNQIAAAVSPCTSLCRSLRTARRPASRCTRSRGSCRCRHLPPSDRAHDPPLEPAVLRVHERAGEQTHDIGVEPGRSSSSCTIPCAVAVCSSSGLADVRLTWNSASASC